MYRYAYLLGSSAFFLLWIPIFIFRKDLRRQMIFMSLMTALAGVLLEYFLWTVDWWRPETGTGTRVGVEDVILGITNGGLAAVLYEVVFRRRTRSLRKDSRVKRFLENRKWLLWLSPLVSSVSGVVVFWILGWHSFRATFLSCLVGVGLIVLVRRDLLLGSAFGGLAMVLVAIPVYELGFLIFPGIVERFWLLHNISGILVLGIPIEDLGFYFAAGAFIAPFYEFIFGEQLVRIPGR